MKRDEFVRLHQAVDTVFDEQGLPQANVFRKLWHQVINLYHTAQQSVIRDEAVAWKVHCETCGSRAAFLEERVADRFKSDHPHDVEKTPLAAVRETGDARSS